MKMMTIKNHVGVQVISHVKKIFIPSMWILEEAFSYHLLCLVSV